MDRATFIQVIGPAANENMKQTGILASLIIAQACLESNFGQSGLAPQSKNLFGIKGRGLLGQIYGPQKSMTAMVMPIPFKQLFVSTMIGQKASMTIVRCFYA